MTNRLTALPQYSANVRMDADTTAFFQRQVESIKAKSFDVQYPELKARSLFPVSYEAGPGAQTIVYYQYNQVGLAQVIAAYADDLPRADITGQEFVSRVKSIGNSYGYNIQEIRTAALAGLPLQQRKANAARRANLQKENKIAFFGDATHGIDGFLSNPNVSIYTVPAGVSLSTLWVNKTPDEVLKDLNAIVHKIVEVTKGVEAPNTLLLPIRQYNYIASTRVGTNTDTTIMQFFLKNNGYISTIEWVNELQGTGTAGADQYVAYNRDPDKLTLEIPQDYEQLAPEPRGLEEVIACHSRIGGVLIYYPLSVCKGQGI